MSAQLRVASLNVQRLSSRQPQRVERIGAFLDRLGSDVIALQEIDDGPALDVARFAGMPHCTFVGHAPSERRGVALCHRAPALRFDGGRLQARFGDDKGFTRISIHVDGREIEIIGLHLDWLSRKGRRRQIAALANAVGRPRGSRIVVGDLNAMTLGTWARGGRNDDTVRALAVSLGVRPFHTVQSTFPSHAPRWALDWILASPDLELTDLHAVPTPLSDHAAIVADVGFRAAA